MKLEHIGIAVPSLDGAENLFSKLLGVASAGREMVDSEGVATSFYPIDNTKIELLEGLGGESPITKFIEKRGAGVHHLAFATEDIFAEIQRLKAAGFYFVSETPRSGADNKMVVFLHPKSTGGVLVELCQEQPNGSIF